jgi:hypothetical protein
MAVHLSLHLGREDPLALLIVSLKARLVVFHLVEHVLALLLHHGAVVAHISTLLQVSMSILE